MKKISGIKIFPVIPALFILFILIPAISGCVRLAKPYPVKQYFVLEAERKAPQQETPSKASIRIKDPEISPIFSGKSFVYKTGKLEFTTDFYNQFFIAPDRMIKSRTVEWFGRSGIFRRISPDPGEKADYILESNIVNIYIDRTASPETAVLETSFFLLSGKAGEKEIIWHGNSKEETKVKEDSPSAMAEAFSTCLEKTLVYLEKNITASVKK